MVYDPSSENEREVPLPSAPRITLASNVLIQPPLTRRGYGPSLVLLLPNVPDAPPIGDVTPTTEQIDPEPIQKWAEEGFAVMAVYPSVDDAGEWTLLQAFENGLGQLKAWGDVNDAEAVKDKVAVIGEKQPFYPRILR